MIYKFDKELMIRRLIELDMIEGIDYIFIPDEDDDLIHFHTL